MSRKLFFESKAMLLIPRALDGVGIFNREHVGADEGNHQRLRIDNGNGWGQRQGCPPRDFVVHGKGVDPMSDGRDRGAFAQAKSAILGQLREQRQFLHRLNPISSNAFVARAASRRSTWSL
jgi:hypothetical protein